MFTIRHHIYFNIYIFHTNRNTNFFENARKLSKRFFIFYTKVLITVRINITVHIKTTLRNLIVGGG
jgi:hypothetical protein